jgi:peptidoglycan/xylan/chitin deacetylase (PgdA/CDA1 family)
VIRLGHGVSELGPRARFGLELLLDASRLIPVDPGSTVPALELAVDPTAVERPVKPDGRRLTVTRGHLEAIARLAGAAEEQLSRARDRYGRVPTPVNPLVAGGTADLPVVNRAGGLLREAASRAQGDDSLLLVAPWPHRRRWAVAVTHDLDIVDWWPIPAALRTLELLRRGELSRAASVLRAAGGAVFGEPVEQGIRDLLRQLASHSIPATWFLLCGTPTFASMRRGDVTYRLEGGRGRRVVDLIRADGHEIGLHGSFATMETSGAFEAERGRMERILGGPVEGVRQHFLRFRPGSTQGAMALAGFRYDASYGFPDRNGFRLGAGDVIPGWDEDRGAATSLEEAPLHWMDRAASKYAGIEDPSRWVDEALQTAGACRDVEGCWIGLWHPNLTPPLGFPGAPEALSKLLTGLGAGEPWFTRLGDAVRWRRARRSLRVAAVGSDGTVQLTAKERPEFPVVLESPGGTLMRTCTPEQIDV